MLRYFLFTGSALLALFFVSDWYWPAAPTTIAGDDEVQETSLDKQILRIRSAQRWPEKIVFDTSIPTIVPPPALVASVPPPPPLVAATLNKSVLDAHGGVRPTAQPKPPVRKTASVRRKKPAPPGIEAYPVASVWSPWR